LFNLKKSGFEYKEWLALKYAQDRAFLHGSEPAGDYMDDYHKYYSEKERAYILKIINMMMFMNSVGNTFFPDRLFAGKVKDLYSCRTDGGKD
jgi:hypothetical protein